MNRRKLLFSGAGILALLGGASITGRSGSAIAKNKTEDFEIQKSDEEWRSVLSKAQYKILREEGTERPFTSPLLAEKRVGNFHCAGCDLAVYPSSTKYKSGTGWPSFYESLPNAIGTKEDRSFFSLRTEVHCRRCGGHFGHIFDDGPAPTGKRHCLNGLSLTFKPTAA